jgi:hypothetical protein
MFMALFSKNLKIKKIYINNNIARCVTRSLTLNDGHKPRIHRRIFRLKTDEKGSEDRYTMRNFIVSIAANIVTAINCRILRWTKHVARMQEGRRPFKTLTGKPTGK